MDYPSKYRYSKKNKNVTKQLGQVREQREVRVTRVG